MKEGGEVVGSGGVSEATGWEEVEALASQAPDESQEQEGGNSGEQAEEHVEKIDLGKLREAALNKAVFTEVNMEEIGQLVGEFIDLVSLEDINELRKGLRENFETGIERAEDYFTNLLELKVKPKVEAVNNLAKGCDGACVMAIKDGLPDVILVNEECKKEPDYFLAILAHENWHSRQHMKINEALSNAEKGDMDYDYRTELYMHNTLHQIKFQDDIEGYAKQLTEAEAYEFEAKFIGKIKEAKKLERKMEFIGRHPEIYGIENIGGIRAEVDTVLTGMDMSAFLKKAGLKTASEVFKKDNDVEQVAQGYVDGLCDLLGIEGVRVDFVDELEDGLRAKRKYNKRRVILNRGKQEEMLSEILPKMIWAFRQNDMIEGQPENERSKLYRSNYENYIRKKDDAVGNAQQLIMRERDEFAETWMRLMDEQATEEEVMEMSLPKRVLAKMALRRNGRAPVLSKKYKVKRSW